MSDLENLVADLAEDAATVRPAPHPYVLGARWALAGLAYLVVTLALSGLRPDLAEALARPWFAAEMLGLFLMFAAASMSAALLSFPDLHQKRALALAPLAAFAGFVAVMYLAWLADDPPAPFPRHSFECTLSITLVALLPAAWTLHAMRRFATTHFMLAGSTAVIAAFSVGAIWLRLHEVNDSVLHVVEWHYLPFIGGGLLGLWLGRRFLKW